MKWDKVVTYLIVIFLCVNIGLAIGNYNKGIKAYKLSDKRVQTIISILRDDDITLKMKLPTTFRPVAPIWVLPVEVTPSIRDSMIKSLLGSGESGIIITEEASELPYEKPIRVYSKGSKQLKFRTNYIYYKDNSLEQGQKFLTESKAKKIAEEFIQQLAETKINKKTKIEYISESYGASITYYEVYNNLPIFGSYIHMKITDEGVFEAKIHRNTITNASNSKKSIYPIDKVLFRLKERIDKSGPLIIDNILLGYAIPDQMEMHVLREEAVPVYKISIQGLDEPIFVNAYTNTVEELVPGTFFK